MTNLIDYIVGTNKGWICPNCGRVYSPNTGQCKHCHVRKTEEDNNCSDKLICPSCNHYMQLNKDGIWFCTCGTKTLF